MAVGTVYDSVLKHSGTAPFISPYNDYAYAHMLIKVYNSSCFTTQFYEKFSVDFVDLFFCLGKIFNVNGEFCLSFL